ncbi:glycosyltransferase [Paenibacillus lautus]|uniref:glycosyltransferase family 2 protein n=1 Tax=Paenibacillus lautus TaxID=1401 RepID=UPI002DB61BA6|nr:glycosyltransferase [Paenibacillus lautus]MEC0204783.1 glycosyltransferase [Paenibacillus lautus]
MTKTSLSQSQPTVSIITCTKRPECLNSLLENYARQNYRNKELIVILNHSSLKLSEYQLAAKPYRNVRVYRKPAESSLGSCLNFGVKVSKHSIIAKFDDDDYYASDYVKDGVHLMIKTSADIVGKRASKNHGFSSRIQPCSTIFAIHALWGSIPKSSPFPIAV